MFFSYYLFDLTNSILFFFFENQVFCKKLVCAPFIFAEKSPKKEEILQKE